MGQWFMSYVMALGGWGFNLVLIWGLLLKHGVYPNIVCCTAAAATIIHGPTLVPVGT